MEGGPEPAHLGRHLVEQRAEAHLAAALLPGLSPGTHEPLEAAVPRGCRVWEPVWRRQK
jgi:hypothetical protein